MTTHVKTHSNHRTARLSRKLPNHVTRQLEGIYQRSLKNIRKHPYTATSSILVSIGIVSGIYFLVRFFKK